MPGLSHIVIILVASGALLALSSSFSLGVSRVLEAMFDAIECHLALREQRRSARARHSVTHTPQAEAANVLAGAV